MTKLLNSASFPHSTTSQWDAVRQFIKGFLRLGRMPDLERQLCYFFCPHAYPPTFVRNSFFYFETCSRGKFAFPRKLARPASTRSGPDSRAKKIEIRHSNRRINKRHHSTDNCLVAACSNKRCTNLRSAGMLSVLVRLTVRSIWSAVPIWPIKRRITSK